MPYQNRTGFFLGVATSLVTSFIAATGAEAMYKDAGPASAAQKEQFCTGPILDEFAPFAVVRYNPSRDEQAPFEMIDCSDGQIFLYDCEHLIALETLGNRVLERQGRYVSDKQAHDFNELRVRLKPYLSYCVATPIS